MIKKNMQKGYRFIIVGFIALTSFSLATSALAATPTVSVAKITGPNTVSVIYTEPVNTTVNDYSLFTGSLGDKGLISISGSGTNVVTLTFNGSTLAPDASGGLTIGNTVTSVSDGAHLGGGPFTVVDGQIPKVSTFSMTSSMIGNTVARAGDTINITFNTNELIYNNPSVKIANTTIAAMGSGSGPYVASYNLTAFDPQDIVPVSMSFIDLAGNHGTGAFTIGGSPGSNITSITSDATTVGTLVVGNSINFTLTLATPVPNAYVAGSYDGVPLTWTSSNNGATYTAMFTVTSSSSSTYSPLQITGVTVRDASGNVSLPASGTDIKKTISTSSFNISLVTAPTIGSGSTQARFAFSSTQDGTITYGGDCSSPITVAATGTNYITFNRLSDGTHSNCTVMVSNGAGYSSNVLALPAFTSSTGNPGPRFTPIPATLDCTGGVAFSAVTGLACPTTPEPIPGCTAGYLFSATNGKACPVASITDATTPAPSAPVTQSSSYKFTLPLKFGSKGAEVSELQKRLKADGYLTAAPNGNFGYATETAVKAYQKAHGLSQLGSVGPGTRSALNK